MVEYFSKPVFLSTIFCILFFYSGLIKIPDQKPYRSLILKNDVKEISGIICNSPCKSSSGKTYSCRFKLEKVCSGKGVISDAKGEITIYIPADMIEAYFPGKLYSLASKKGQYLYETGGTYSFSGNYTEKGFIVQKCNGNSWPDSFYGKADKFRAVCRLQFKRLMYSWGDAGGLLLALLCGAREYTDVETANAFKNAGLSHILALSGMHLSMFSAIAIFVGNKVGRKKMTFIIRIIALILFVWFAGFSPSLMRAFICAMLILFAAIASVNQPDMLMVLCFSFLLQCVISPSDINNAGFLLSYGALAGILITNKMFFRIFAKLFPNYIAASLSSSTGANLFTAPISLKLFGSFNPVGIVATTFVSPLVTVFIYSGLTLIIICLMCPILMKPSGIFMNIQYTIIKSLVKIFSKVPGISI